jgi:hypothetical protein
MRPDILVLIWDASVVVDVGEAVVTLAGQFSELDQEPLPGFLTVNSSLSTLKGRPRLKLQSLINQ